MSTTISTTTAPQTLDTSNSPFHAGEHAAQTRLGVREKMERFGNRVIRDFMPEQHQAFYQQLPFVFVGHEDDAGWPWASILFNEPGFMSSVHPKKLTINAQAIAGDPLAQSLKADTRLGLLGIELPTRRRNRLAAHITSNSPDSIQLEVDQAFGNCPQYIQTRELEFLDKNTRPATKIETLTEFDKRARQLIEASDTFFVASSVNHGNGHASDGADVSHRGGKPGFVRVDNNRTLTIPDYLGNFHFNTFGNFIENPKAGLLFIDFENGHLLTLTGRVEILWDSPETEFFEGAERLWQFHLEDGRYLQHALPLRWKLDQYSQNTLLTGTWDETEKLRQAELQKNQYLPYTISQTVDESSVIKSFHLTPLGHQATKFKPGQFLTLKTAIDGDEHIRTYTLSSAPADPEYRISIKRETSRDGNHPDGAFSNFMHDEVQAGDVIYAKAPQGAFTFDTDIDRPAVLLAGGVGVTPMISMMRHALIEGVRTRAIRPTTFIGAARNDEQRAFFDELNAISEQSHGSIRAFWALSELAGHSSKSHLKAGQGYHHRGRIDAALLQTVLPLDDYDFYLCGPSGFMQSSYDLLRQLGVNDCRINAEEFGPASLKRDVDKASTAFEARPAAQEAIIEFTESKVEQAWSATDGTLLEFAEAHGLSPEFGCRSGQCGACKTTVMSGKVAHQTEPSSELNANEVLLCCAVPAAIEGEDVARLAIKL